EDLLAALVRLAAVDMVDVAAEAVEMAGHVPGGHLVDGDAQAGPAVGEASAAAVGRGEGEVGGAGEAAPLLPRQGVGSVRIGRQVRRHGQPSADARSTLSTGPKSEQGPSPPWQRAFGPDRRLSAAFSTVRRFYPSTALFTTAAGLRHPPHARPL